MAGLDINVRQANADFQAIKDKIVKNGVEVAEGTPTADYAPKIDEVYEVGRKSQYDVFCDIYYNYGKRQSFENAFAGDGWTNDSIPLKYDIKPKNAYMMFRGTRISGDLKALFESWNIVFDTSNCEGFGYMFNIARSITKVGVLDLSSVPIPPQGNTDAIFNNANALEEIELIRTSNEVFPQFGRTAFHNLNSLVEIRFEGTIADELSIKDSTKLSKASWVNIVGCYSTTISGLSMTGSLASVNSAFETSEGANDGSTSAEWLNLIATRPNVSFNLV